MQKDNIWSILLAACSTEIKCYLASLMSLKSRFLMICFAIIHFNELDLPRDSSRERCSNGE